MSVLNVSTSEWLSKEFLNSVVYVFPSFLTILPIISLLLSLPLFHLSPFSLSAFHHLLFSIFYLPLQVSPIFYFLSSHLKGEVPLLHFVADAFASSLAASLVVSYY